MTPTNSEPLNKSLESEMLRKKVIAMLEGSGVDCSHDSNFMSHGFYAVEGILFLLESELKKQREDIRKQLPEKKVDADYDEIKAKYPDLPKTLPDVYEAGFNELHDQITKILDGDNDE